MADPPRARRLAKRIAKIVASGLEHDVKDPRLAMVTRRARPAPAVAAPARGGPAGQPRFLARGALDPRHARAHPHRAGAGHVRRRPLGRPRGRGLRGLALRRPLRGRGGLPVPPDRRARCGVPRRPLRHRPAARPAPAEPARLQGGGARDGSRLRRPARLRVPQADRRLLGGGRVRKPPWRGHAVCQGSMAPLPASSQGDSNACPSPPLCSRRALDALSHRLRRRSR